MPKYFLPLSNPKANEVAQLEAVNSQEAIVSQDEDIYHTRRDSRINAASRMGKILQQAAFGQASRVWLALKQANSLQSPLGKDLEMSDETERHSSEDLRRTKQVQRSPRKQQLQGREYITRRRPFTIDGLKRIKSQLKAKRERIAGRSPVKVQRESWSVDMAQHLRADVLRVIVSKLAGAKQVRLPSLDQQTSHQSLSDSRVSRIKHKLTRLEAMMHGIRRQTSQSFVNVRELQLEELFQCRKQVASIKVEVEKAREQVKKLEARKEQTQRQANLTVKVLDREHQLINMVHLNTQPPNPLPPDPLPPNALLPNGRWHSTMNQSHPAGAVTQGRGHRFTQQTLPFSQDPQGKFIAGQNQPLQTSVLSQVPINLCRPLNALPLQAPTVSYIHPHPDQRTAVQYKIINIRTVNTEYFRHSGTTLLPEAPVKKFSQEQWRQFPQEHGRQFASKKKAHLLEERHISEEQHLFKEQHLSNKQQHTSQPHMPLAFKLGSQPPEQSQTGICYWCHLLSVRE